MNRAMGFGILSGTMTGTMLASVAIAPTPALAADTVTITGPFGSVSINPTRTVVTLTDAICGDDLEPNAQLKYADGRILPTIAGACDGLTIPPGQTRGVITGAYAMRKCVHQVGVGDTCDDQGWHAL